MDNKVMKDTSFLLIFHGGYSPHYVDFLSFLVAVNTWFLAVGGCCRLESKTLGNFLGKRYFDGAQIKLF